MNDATGLALERSEERFRLLVDGVRDYAIVMLDADGCVLTWNAGAQRILGYTSQEIVGRHFAQLSPSDPQAQQRALHELDAARRRGSHEDEGWRVRKDGTRLWANVVTTALFDAGGGPLVGYANVTRDLTQRRAQEESLRRSEERFRLMVEGVSDYAMFMLDANGRVATWNSGAERITGYHVGEITGKDFSIFYPEDVREAGWPQHELQVAFDAGRFDDEGWRVRKDGELFWARVTLTALRDATGRLFGFAKLTRDLSERRRAEALERKGEERDAILEAERSARMNAQRAARVKDEFLATLSHELRTPLSAILGWTQVLRRAGDKLSAEDVRHGVEVIDRNARAQNQLIDDLLDLSRIMGGRARLNLRTVLVGDVVRSAVESVEPAALAKEVAIEVVLDPVPAMMIADNDRLQQIVWNLLTNAVKFTPKGGHVRVAVRTAPDSVELTVSDTGVGIPEAFLPLVFDRFSQRDGSASRRYGGLGLGLAITKQLVELHGGSIRVSSPGEGQGSTFVVELPVSSAEDPHEADMPPSEHDAPAADEIASMPSLDGVRVLVVDDEEDARDVTRRALVEQGARVQVCVSAEEASAAVKAGTVDVIVSDIGLPRVDGYQFMRALRAGERPGERVPALALTAFARAEDRRRALLAGYQAHLAKPFDLGELVLLVAGLVGRR